MVHPTNKPNPNGCPPSALRQIDVQPLGSAPICNSVCWHNNILTRLPIKQNWPWESMQEHMRARACESRHASTSRSRISSKRGGSGGNVEQRSNQIAPSSHENLMRSQQAMPDNCVKSNAQFAEKGCLTAAASPADELFCHDVHKMAQTSENEKERVRMRENHQVTNSTPSPRFGTPGYICSSV